LIGDGLDRRQSNYLMDWEMSGTRVLLTGASRGIGQEFARFLGEVGAHVILAARDIELAQKVQERIIEAGGVASLVKMDVTDTESIRSAVEEAEKAVGPIEVLINNAGTMPYEEAMEQDVSKWDTVLATNLRGPWYLSCEVAKRMREREIRGRILNIASISGINRATFMAGYCTSKAALIHLTSCLALEWAGFGIRVNAIAPGTIDIGMGEGFADTPAGKRVLARIPMARLGTAEDLKVPLLWLSSRHSSYITGSCVVVDGGWLDFAA
jgi:NAD(P)-dependent dehydrogenase (short-subunit alcohol dehydrogenase family)